MSGRRSWWEGGYRCVHGWENWAGKGGVSIGRRVLEMADGRSGRWNGHVRVSVWVGEKEKVKERRDKEVKLGELRRERER